MYFLQVRHLYTEDVKALSDKQKLGMPVSRGLHGIGQKGCEWGDLTNMREDWWLPHCLLRRYSYTLVYMLSLHNVEQFGPYLGTQELLTIPDSW